MPLLHVCSSSKKVEAAYLTPEQVLDIAREGAKAGCKEILFTLGDKPEARYKAARDGLAELGYETTLDYLRAMAELVFTETGLSPHLNPGLMTREEMAALRKSLYFDGDHARISLRSTHREGCLIRTAG